MSRDLKQLIQSIRNRDSSITFSAVISQLPSLLYSFFLIVILWMMFKDSKENLNNTSGTTLLLSILLIFIFFVRYMVFKKSIETDQEKNLSYLKELRKDNINKFRLKTIEEELSSSINSQTSIITWTISTTLVVLSLLIGFYSNFIQTNRNLISQIWIDKALKSDEFSSMSLADLSEELSLNKAFSDFGNIEGVLLILILIFSIFYVTITLALFKKKYLLSIIRNLIALDDKYPVRHIHKEIKNEPNSK